MLNHSKHISATEIYQFRRKILNWYKAHGRNFPWRKKSISNYQKVMAEILLQRTQADTIAKFWQPFFTKFPSWKSMLNVSLKEMEKIIKPIGLYHAKAKGLLSLAKAMKQRRGRFPKNKKALEKLPLIGPYNANAILTVIYNERQPLLDGNMTRVLERYFGKKREKEIHRDPYLQELATRVVNIENSKIINWAILDFAAKVCQARTPKCEGCVLKRKCASYKVTPY